MHIQTANERLLCLKNIYIVLMLVLHFDYSLMPLFDYEGVILPAHLCLTRIIVSMTGVFIWKAWKDRGFLLLASVILIQITRIIFIDARILFEETVSTYILNGIWIISGSYVFGKVLSQIRHYNIIRLPLFIWLMMAMIYSLLGIFVAWTDQKIMNLSGLCSWDISWYGRLRAGYVYPNTAGSFFCISGLVAIFIIISERNKNVKATIGLFLLVIIIALGLTDARTSIISFAAGIGMMIFSIIIWRLNKSEKKRKKQKTRNIRNSLIALLGAIFVSALSFLVIIKTVPVFNHIKTNRSIIVSTAYAEDADNEKQILIERRNTGFPSLSGREAVWKTVIHYIFEKPSRFMFGESIYYPTAGPNQRMEEAVGHCHNMVLQILLESGLIGLIPILVFGFLTARNAFRIIYSMTLPLWPRLIPAIPISILVGDLAECFGWFAEWKSPALPFLFISCGIINAIGSKQKSLEETNGIPYLCPEK